MNAESLEYCQGAKYRACAGGKRLCQKYMGLWLCRKCWRHREAIVKIRRRTNGE